MDFPAGTYETNIDGYDCGNTIILDVSGVFHLIVWSGHGGYDYKINGHYKTEKISANKWNVTFYQMDVIDDCEEEYEFAGRIQDQMSTITIEKGEYTFQQPYSPNILIFNTKLHIDKDPFLEATILIDEDVSVSIEDVEKPSLDYFLSKSPYH